MGRVLIQLLPLVIASVIMPTWAVLVLYILRSERGLVAAIAFLGGVTLTRLLQGVIFGTMLGAYEVVHHSHNLAGTIVSTLLLVIGILMWGTALKQLFRQDDDDLASPLSKVLDMISAITPLRALALGMLLVVTSSPAWIFTLTALGIISQGGLTIAQSVVAFLLYVLGTQLLLVAPILVSTRSLAWFDVAAQWVEEHHRPIVVAVFLVVGSLFLWRGGTGLIS